MDPSGDCQISPSDMLISPKWGFLLSVLLLVNLSLVAWAAAFVPDQRPAASSPVTAPPDVSHPPAPVIARAASVDSGASKVAMSPAAQAPISPPPTANITSPAEANAQPAPLASIGAERTPESETKSSQPEPNQTEPSPPESNSPESSESAPAAAAAPLPEVPAGLVVINPPSTGGTVHFLLAEEVITLEPGEFHTVAEIDERVVKFDRGEDFGQVEQNVSDEVWMFAVGPRGWHFQLIDRQEAARHLAGCRPRTVSTDSPTTEPATTEP